MKMNNDTDKKAISKLDLEMHSENCQTNSHFCKKTTPLRCFTGHQVRKIDEKIGQATETKIFLKQTTTEICQLFHKKTQPQIFNGVLNTSLDL